MDTPLFVDQPLQFEKAAAVARLSDDPEKWGREVTTELYRHIPFLDKYSVEIRIDRVDPERGFGLGAAIVANRTARTEVEALQGGQINYARIPVIIKGSMLEPFDVFLYGGEVQPLTEDRFNTAMFRPEMFDAVRSAPASPSLINNLFPPVNFRHGMQGIGTGVGVQDIGKLGSVQLEQLWDHLIEKGAQFDGMLTLRKVASTVRHQDLERIRAGLLEPSVKVAALQNPYFTSALDVLGEAAVWSEKDASAREATLKAAVTPNVVQLEQRVDGNVLMKIAHHEFFDQEESVLSVEEARQMLGEGVVEKLAADGVVTLVTDVPAWKGTDVEPAEVAEHYCEFATMSKVGNASYAGVVFPKVVDLDMNELPLTLFTNGQQMALQEKIAGRKLEQSKLAHILGTDQPEGGDLGTFLFADDRGGIRATIPVKIACVTTVSQGGITVPTYHGEDDYGRKVDITPGPGLLSVEKVGHVGDTIHYAVPTTFRFMRLPEEKVALQDEPQMMPMVKSDQWLVGHTKIAYDRAGAVSLDGIMVQHVPEEKRAFVSPAQAEFILALAGVSPEVAREKLAYARRYGGGVAYATRPISTYEQKLAQSRHDAAIALGEMPNMKQLLLKEAATIPDGATVDSLLSLNFITPENMYLFAESLPQFEATQKRIAELLLGARLGMPMPVGALEKAMHFMEEVLLAMKAMAGGYMASAASA